MKEEYFFDRAIADMLIENHFDSSHNTFESIRRVADIYEWGNNVMIPGLFANSGPCASFVGATSAFASATDRPSPTDFSAAMAAKGSSSSMKPRPMSSSSTTIRSKPF